MIVDPETDRVIARSHDLRYGKHPLQHATMVCIDMVAKSQGGGMWKYKGMEPMCCKLLYWDASKVQDSVRPDETYHMLTGPSRDRVGDLGPVVQSVISLTSSLRVILLTFLADSIHNILLFFAEKM